MNLKAISKILLAAFAAAVLATPAFAETAVNGNIEINTDYISDHTEGVGAAKDVDTTTYAQGGRAELIFTGKTSEGTLYADGKACFEVPLSGGDFGVCDIYVKLGSTASNMDVQIGRFEANGLYTKGADIAFANAPGVDGVYEVNYARGRGADPYGAAFHVNGDTVNFELNVLYGNKDDSNVIGFRPFVTIGMGAIEAKVALETRSTSTQDSDLDGTDTKSGAGLVVKYTADAFSAGLNLTSGKETGEDATGVDKDDVTRTAVGVFADINLDKNSLGLGFHRAAKTTDMVGTDPEESQNIFFIAYQMPILDSTALKFAYSGANGTQDNGGKNTIDSSESVFRFRVNHNF